MGTVTSSPATETQRTHVLINRNFALLWSGQAISSIGDAVFNITLILWIATQLGARQSWAPAAVSGIIIADLVPTFLIGPVAGVFVDRWSKRTTMLAMDALRAILLLTLLPAAGIVSLPGGFLPRPPVGLQLGATYTVVVLATVCSQFFGPSRVALIGDVVPGEQLGRASGLGQMTQSLPVIIGPPIGASLFLTLGIRWALILNALSFAISFLAVDLVHAPESARSVADGEQGNVWREFRDGLRFFAGNRVLVTLLVSCVLAMLRAGALTSLDIFFVTQNLHTQPSAYGWLEAAFGVGALAGGIGASIFGDRIGAARLCWTGMIGAGVGLMLYSRVNGLIPALILLGLLGIPIAGVNVAMMPLMLGATPREFIGRVTAVIQPAVSLASITSIAIAGLLVSTVLHGLHVHFLGTLFGPVDSVFLAAGVFILLGGVYAMRRLRHTPPVPESSAAGVPHASA